MAIDEVVLAKPRGFCAGVDRAIEIVEKALELFDKPVYVRKEIVHNRHVVTALQEQGAVFVDELDEVPDGTTLIFSAHGVAPSVWQAAEAKDLRVIDATCPLVTKVHLEVLRYAKRDYTIVLIGHEDHDEVIGTRGEAPDHIQVISTVEDIDKLEVPDPSKIVCLTQTTLSMDDTADVINGLRQAYPQMVTPSKDDICYATQNRQQAVKAMTEMVDLVLVIGASNSSNSNRLREVAEVAGVRAYLINQVSDITPEMVASANRVGITAGASTPEFLVQEVITYCQELGAQTTQELTVVEENVKFLLPSELVQLS
ncbi:4-hydroxy-3-methylbut-2-enyl diphosphate reductase [Candidatus Entotheonella palauensis]|uniref:4-hydroxy-3-methylbut-2-enyl diphosphate reductase n=1 Tax=Candidatus Entotheonella palauensis TaxID=93172 RepID=UPI000B7E20FB|nr:4-hydroxy-3-methylbut-2-enyl diphosphate reductase [Candidatus Entotheonella palauensis]